MKKNVRHLLLGLLPMLLFQPFHSVASTNQIDTTWIGAIQNQHGLTLPAWGPYTKRYAGISHVPATNAGLRFDLSVFPGLYRRKANPPNVLFESGYYPWETTPDLSCFAFRLELEWKDQVYADISYTKLDDHSRLIRAECVNNTDLPQNLVLHLMASMNFPAIHPASVALPPGAVWVSAIDYKSMRYAKSRPTDTLVYDGKLLGEIRADGFVNGSGLGGGFGAAAGDTAAYEFKINEAIPDARLVVRYRINQGAKTTLHLDGITNGLVDFTGNGGLQTQVLSLGKVDSGIQKLAVSAEGGKAIELDGFALVPAQSAGQVEFHQQTWDPKPEMLRGPKSNSLILKYKDADDYYGLAWAYDQFEVRQFLCKDLDIFFPTMAQNHVSEVLRGEGDGHYTDIFLRPITIAPHTRSVVYGTICNGTRAEVEQRLAAAEKSAETGEAIYAAALVQLPDLKPAPQGSSFEFSQQRMAATLLGNVVYPVYTQRSYIKHNTPGKWWDSLYTWDSGFIGLGLADLDTRRALECLNTYLTEPGTQSAFIHHGSMVPVQFYLFLDLWNRTQSRELLEYAYPRLKQYYEFYVGRLGSSSTGKFKSGVLSTFDYFYNSGGWDDYPPQKYTHQQKLGNRISPVVNTAHAIRIAKIMALAADALGRPEDVRIYQQDIASFSNALQKNSWDETSGYFGYLQHDANGLPVGLLKFENHTNYNMGMDGVYPLVADMGTAKQTQKMLERLKSPDRLWSRIGLSAVDQSAPYYRDDGYWNGTVWMPHQWFFWKAMLDLGESDFAWQIARRGLEVWRDEVNASYNCMEHFLIKTGRGAGWHQFGGLSTPVLKWYSAYCRPGTLTTGFNMWIKHQQFNADQTGLEADMKWFPAGSTRSCLVVCMNPAYSYHVEWNNQPLTLQIITNGLLNIMIPTQGNEGRLVISKKH